MPNHDNMLLCRQPSSAQSSFQLVSLMPNLEMSAAQTVLCLKMSERVYPGSAPVCSREHGIELSEDDKVMFSHLSHIHGFHLEKLEVKLSLKQFEARHYQLFSKPNRCHNIFILLWLNLTKVMKTFASVRTCACCASGKMWCSGWQCQRLLSASE